MYNYELLKKRIAEGYSCLSAFAEAVKVAESTLVKKLSNVLPFSYAEIERAVDILEISPSEINFYFFSLHPSAATPNKSEES